MPLFEGLALGTDKHSVVIEIGQAYTKCGFVHEYSPRAIIRSEIFCPPLKKVARLAEIRNPDWLYVALKEFVENLYFRYLAVNPKERKVVIVESIFCPTYFRKTLANVLFYHFDIPGLLVVPQHLMTLMPLQLQSALVVDVGYVECSVVPVIEGVTLLDAVQFGPFGSRSIHDRVRSELIEQKATIRDTESGNNRQLGEEDRLEERVLEDIKVRTCFVAPFERGQRLIEYKSETIQRKDIEAGLPKDVLYPVDGQKLITIPGLLREMACQIMFEIYGNESSIANLILDALLKCPRDARKMLASNIIVVGGTSSLPGFKHRLFMDIKHLVTSDNNYKENLSIDVFKLHKPPCKENYVAWLGAAIFGSTDAITLRAVTRDQFLRSNGSVLTDWSEWWPQSRAA